ncbi:thioredoxin [Thiomicrospira cyclica]|uniref:Thioredoxin n=1 Tax=Thiomicrospira cyclica (strain DSM 14477 / JCM 11371 / ALM1) TaxID=717773 RepID=F6D8G4_THICA|nr:thioredoxin [Thiomicrospira cyclica]AEG31815.1 thioredoxin [Thiomicrospira cyclica ALM1]
MALVNLTADAFDEFIAQHDMIIFDFWAEWCGPCKQFGPVFEAASEQHPNIMFAKVNVEEQPDLANMFQVRSIPTIAFMREKVVVYANPGALPASNFEQGIQEMLNLDMAKVHADVAEMQQQQ